MLRLFINRDQVESFTHEQWEIFNTDLHLGNNISTYNKLLEVVTENLLKYNDTFTEDQVFMLVYSIYYKVNLIMWQLCGEDKSDEVILIRDKIKLLIYCYIDEYNANDIDIQFNKFDDIYKCIER